jgi:hypothetical protein
MVVQLTVYDPPMHVRWLFARYPDQLDTTVPCR